MARSYIDPSLVAMAVEPAAPPWNWNPGATFVEAFNEAQRTKMAREKMELDNWMSNQLFPLQKQKMALELDKLQGEIERQTLLTQMDREAYKTTHQNLMNGMQNPGPIGIIDTSNVNFNSPTSTPAPSGKIKLP